MKITKRQLKRIIKEERAKLQEMDPASAGMAAARQDDRMRGAGIDPNMGIFNPDYLYDLFYDEFENSELLGINMFQNDPSQFPLLREMRKARDTDNRRIEGMPRRGVTTRK